MAKKPVKRPAPTPRPRTARYPRSDTPPPPEPPPPTAPTPPTVKRPYPRPRKTPVVHVPPPETPPRAAMPMPVNPPAPTPTPTDPASPANVAIGRRIRSYRVAAHLSQLRLADKLGSPFTQAALSLLEAGDRQATHELLVRLADALACDPCDLDVRLAPRCSVSLVRTAVGPPAPGKPAKPVDARWEPLREADRVTFDAVWEGPGPSSREKIGELVEGAIDHGVALIFRGELGVREVDAGGDG